MDTSIEQFSDIIGKIYEASLVPDKWPLALQALCEQLDANKAQIIYLDPKQQMLSFACGYGFDPYAHNIGAGRFRRFLADDPITRYGTSHLGKVFSDRLAIDPRESTRSGMYREIRRPADMEYLLTAFFADDTEDLTGICFFRGENQSAFSAKDESTLSDYIPHFRRATHIHKCVASASQIKIVQSSILDGIDTPMILVDDQHEIVTINHAATKLIERTDIINLRSQRLICKHTGDNRKLHCSIDDAFSAQDNVHETRNFAIKLRGNPKNSPIFAIASSLQDHTFEEKRQNLPVTKAHYTARIPCRKNVLITLCDPNQRKAGLSEMLQELFDLTPAEAALAKCLSEDFSLKEAANLLGRSIGTARIQLQSIFDKTDTNRQSSLMRLVMSIP